MTRSLFSLLALGALAAGASAQFTVVVPPATAAAEGASSTAYPWGRGASEVRVQYIYDSANFAGVTGPMTITRLRWRANGTTTISAGGTYGSATVDLSTAAVDYAAAGTTFASNHGLDQLQVYSGPVTVQATVGTTPNNWYVDIPLTAPFTYDPAAGDLLIDVACDSTTFSGVTPTTLDCATTGSLTSRVYNLTSHTATTGSFQNNVGPTLEITYVQNGLFASFDATPTTGASPLQVQFTDRSFSSDPGGVTSWAWDFDNDGVTDSTAQNPTHTYTGCGTYSVRLTVTDAANPPSSQLRLNYIATDEVTPSFTSALIAPGLVQFTDTSTPTPTSWAWDLDGDTIVDSTAQNPVFNYGSNCAGPTNVTLTVNRLCRGPFTVARSIYAASFLETRRDGGTSIAAGGGNYFDVNVTNPLGISVCRMEMKTTATSAAAVTFNVFVTPGTHVGNETNIAVWRQIATAATTGAANTADLEMVQFNPPFYLPPGNYGVHVQVQGGGPQYSTQTAATAYTNSDLTITTGSSGVLGGSPIANRVWNGAFYYSDCSGGQEAGFTFFAPGCAGTQAIATQTASSLPRLGQPFTISVDNLPLSVGLMVLGVSRTSSIYGPLPLDLSIAGAPGCFLHVSDNAKSIMIGTGGTASWTLNIPNNGSLLCMKVFAQTLVVDPTANNLGAVMSDAGAAIVGS